MTQNSIEVIKYISQDTSELSITDISNIIIAFCTLLLTGYIFIYQKNKDKESNRATAELNNQNLKLQWFKDLIIQPHLEILNKTFNNLLEHPSLNVSPNSPDYQLKTENYIKFTKTELFTLRKNFVSLFLTVNNQLYSNAISLIDSHIDEITKKLIDEMSDLGTDSLNEDILIKRVISARNAMIKLIYSFNGK